ncbi:hypothetical protein M3612_08520 [Niallia taxi]|uniref:hypothetical protein n=1 Tax=Niallia taxi TaxID=2499688 RepID=UPI00203D9299|nr:hypothetical protein [Niallia taxi]MCM3214548.1 hypothetical protein [Niallia taxi]
MTTPWYLKKKVLFGICFLVPPIAYIIIIGNKKKLARKRYLEYLTLATMMVSIWLLKFTPAPIRITVLLTIIFILLYRRIKKTKKK